MKEKRIINLLNYKSTNEIWENKSSIRTRPARVFSKDNSFGYYAESRQPLCKHPLITRMNPEDIQFILIQSAYKFMQDIAQTETIFVAKTAHKIAFDQTGFLFPTPIKNDILTVIIDEIYHAYVANDYNRQLYNVTGIEPLAGGEPIHLLDSIEKLKFKISAIHHDLFEVIILCIVENAITSDVISIHKDKRINENFYNVNADHLLDESRHSNVFASLLKIFWQQLIEDEKIHVGSVLPAFIKHYLISDHQKKYDRLILNALNIIDHDIEIILNDSSSKIPESYILENNPMIFNILKMLHKCDIFKHDITKHAFVQEGFKFDF